MKTIGKTRIEYVLNPDGTRGFHWNPLTGCAHGPDVCLQQPFPREPSTIFTCDRGDLWGDGVPENQQDAVLDRIRREPQHTCLTLTKAPHNYGRIRDWPANLWVGASATDAETCVDALDELFHVSGRKWLSLEPLFAPAELCADALIEANISWLVIGALAPGRVTQREWVKAVVQACVQADIPYWEKYNLADIVTRPLRQQTPWVRR